MMEKKETTFLKGWVITGLVFGLAVSLSMCGEDDGDEVEEKEKDTEVNSDTDSDTDSDEDITVDTDSESDTVEWGDCVLEIQTEKGTVMGHEEEADTCAWFGVPYGKPPVGDLRWKAPRDVEAWGDVLAADEFEPACTQYGGMMAYMDPEVIKTLKGREDCLYLNIWRPNTEEKNLDVFFWIHGGANEVGRSGWIFYSGANLANQSNMVFVSLNYRLGPFGRFTHPALRTNDDTKDDSGNYGTLDIIKALEWVRDNIEAFGGNPDNVMIAGESAGGINVFSMLTSPLAKGLFHKAATQSGGPLSVPVNQGDIATEDVLTKLLVADEIISTPEEGPEHIETMTNDEIAEYLRGKSAEEFFAIFTPGNWGTIGYGGDVYTDGHVIPKNMLSMLADGNYNKVPAIVGCNQEEIKLFLPLMVGEMNEKEFAGMIRDYDVGRMDEPKPQVKLSEVLSPPVQATYQGMADVGNAVWEETSVLQPARAIANHQDDIYSFEFQWKDEPYWEPLVLGASHAMEISFMLGNFYSDEDFPMRICWNEANRQGREELSHNMMSFWANLARNGDPNGPSLPKWEPWVNEPGGPKRIKLDKGMNDKPDNMMSSVPKTVNLKDLAPIERAIVKEALGFLGVNQSNF
ncbi:MAG: carboxylesterase family protein [Proteobacteria bacterium]|nr:carboxylesterase family protein [Pseudomonadota bacterium]